MEAARGLLLLSQTSEPRVGLDFANGGCWGADAEQNNSAPRPRRVVRPSWKVVENGKTTLVLAQNNRLNFLL